MTETQNVVALSMLIIACRLRLMSVRLARAE
jgi:hypothetical protein